MPITISYNQSSDLGRSADGSPAIRSYATLGLDPVTGDLADPPVILTGADALVQDVRCRFRFFLGEWFLDQRLGVPYYKSVLVKNPNRILITAIFREVLLGTPGIASVKSFSSTLDRPTRTLTSNFEAVSQDGDVITAVDEPFIIGAS